MAGYLPEIIRFLEAKGLSKIAIAGIVGNFKVESDFNPNAYNDGEGAIGFGQWEDGRRTALQQWALSHYGAQETDAQAQLSFMWHELTTSYSGVLAELRNATSVGEAATIWDSQYEISDGSTRSDRISYAQQWYSGEPLSGSNGPAANYSPDSAGGGSGGGNADPTMSDYKGIDALGSLLNSVPALKNLVNKAIDGGWSLNRFENAVENSDWWKNHSDTARQVLIQQANDPASYQQAFKQTIQHIRDLAHQAGFGGLDHDTLQGIAQTAMLTGQTTNDQWLTQQLGHNESYRNLHEKGLDNLGGEMAANAQQIQQLAGQYGLRLDPNDIAHRAKMITMGVNTIDGYRQQAIDYAKSAFPSFAKQLDENQTMMDIANPYISSASQLLEQDPSKFDLYNPLIRKGLQGISAKPGEPPSSMPLWQFENTVRQDPRWQYTNNAKQNAASMLLQLGQSWGFNG